MKSSFLKKIIPHLIAAGIFLVIAIVFCSPALQGKVVQQHDILGWKGMAQQSFEYKEKNGHFPLWTNSMFSGMPAYSIAIDQKYPVSLGLVYSLLTLGLPIPISYFFAACLCFYFLCQVLRIRPWLSIMAAIAFTYSTYDPIIVAVGHNSKMQALALAPAVVASFLLLLQRKYWWGLALLTIFFGLQSGTQHLQIVYYTLITLGAIAICFLIYSVRSGHMKNVFTPLALAVLAGGLGYMTSAVSLLPLQEYAKESMRGGESQLKDTAGTKKQGGLDKEYAFRWSYGIGETATILVPDSYGGSDGGGAKHYSAPTKFSEKLTQAGMPEESAIDYENAYSYWGSQPGTSGPVYLGAIICFLFIFALVYLKGWHKWWLIATAVIGILLAWGKNFSAFNYFLFDYLPLYNKFRAPSMGLVLTQFAFPLLAALSLDQLFNDKLPRDLIWKKFRLTVVLTAAAFVIVGIIYINSDFKGRNDSYLRDSFAMQMSRGNSAPDVQQQAQSFATSLVKALQDDRKSLFGGDLLRSFILVALAVVLLGAYIKNKIKELILSIGLLVLSSYDLLAVGKRYLSNDRFIEKDDFENAIQPSAADSQIMADPNKPFRVFDQTEEWYQSSRASYFHNSVGGYHPAKLELYNDLIERQIGKGNMEVLNMLNTKYFIMGDATGRQTVARLNPDAFGPVWIAKGIKYVSNADEEMKALDSTNLKDTAVVQEKFKTAIKFQPQFDSTATIKVKDYLNDIIRYDFNSTTNQFVVFSEIYYEPGWNAFIDGQKSEYVKTNYALRGMSVPAGKHTIEFRFEPKSYQIGNLITLLASLVAYALLALAIFMQVKKKNVPA